VTTSRGAYAALAVLLLAACTSHPTALPSPAPSPAMTTRPAATYDPHDPRCRTTGTAGGNAEYGIGRILAFTGPRDGVVAFGRLLWRTTDGGATWDDGHQFPNEPTDIVPAGCRTLYLTTGPQLFRSDDAGATWVRRGDFSPARLAFVSPEVGYGAPDQHEDPNPSALFKTVDGARTWRQVFAAGSDVVSVSADRTRLLVGTAGGILRSTDGGVHLASVLTTGMPMDVALAPGGPGGWAIGFRTVNYRPEYAAWYSPDLLHWRRIAAGRVQDDSGNYPPAVHSLTGAPAVFGAASAMFPGNDGHRASVTVTTDGGRTLRRVFVGPADEFFAPPVTGIQWVDARVAYLTLGIRPLVYRTADGGRTWTELSL
jgi:photosystem II stability/assembly factor-like uncharacterized protein